ncbi:MAG: hypothetical protein AAF213_00440, partial [Pseudomonadota bacterium]
LGALGGSVSTLGILALLIPGIVDARPDGFGRGMGGGDRGLTGGSASMLKAADLDQDRRLSLTEYKAFRDGKFSDMDADDDGQLTQQESLDYIMARVAARVEKRYERGDQDGDGQISDAEFKEGSLIQFGRFDRNNDGYLSRDDRRRGGSRGGHDHDQKPEPSAAE